MQELYQVIGRNYPPRCEICGAPGRRLRNGAGVCDDCREVIASFASEGGNNERDNAES